MYRIAGTMLFPPGHIPEETLKWVSRRLNGREPDEGSLFISAGGRSVSNETGDLTMVFSGEIYNRQYLRDYLRKKGHSFRTGEDAEIIVHLYEEFREKCLRHINGVFAVSLWDKKRKILFLARDRTGIKPLFYAVLNDQIIFASKIKAILSYPGFPRDMDWAAFSHYLSFYYISSPRSIYQHIKRLPVGHERMSVDFLLKSFTRGAHFQLEKAHMHYKEIFSEEERGIY